jgi:putative glutamine amidotransferase
MTKKVLIGLTGSFDEEDRWSYVKSQYVTALAAAGAACVIIAPDQSEESVRTVIDMCDGVLLTGGEDIDPGCYRAMTDPKCGTLSPRRDELDAIVVRACLEKKKPVLGICRGMQALNVFTGGTLIQDIPSAFDTPVKHTQPEDYVVLTHSVESCGSAEFHSLVGAVTLMTNSRHHQCVDKPGKNVKILARCPTDNVPEAIMVEGHPFAYAVQWHPEWLIAHEEHLNIFKALVKAAADRKI